MVRYLHPSKRAYVSDPAALLVTMLVTIVLSGLLASCGGRRDVPSLIEAAQRFHQKGENKSAIIELKNALQIDPGNAASRLLLGKVYLESGDSLSAEKELRKAQSLGLPPAAVLPALGKALLLSGQFDKVLAEMRIDPAAAPDIQVSVLGVRGDAFLALGDPRQAGVLYARMLALQPGAAVALRGQARIVSVRQPGEALALIDQALRVHPGDVDSLLLRGDLLRLQKKPQEARVSYLDVVKLRPENVAAHVALVNLSTESGKFADAKTELDAARKAAPGNLQLIQAQALLDYRQRRPKAALESLQQILRASPEYMPAILLSGAVHLALGSTELARQDLQRFLDVNSGNVYASKMLADVFIKQGRPDSAAALLAPLLDANQDDAGLLTLAGQAQLNMRHYREAGGHFEKASALAPEMSALRTALALSSLGVGDTGRAIQELERAAALDAKGNEADTMLVMTYLRTGELDKALAAVDAAEKKQPESPLIYNLRGGVLLAKKDHAGARRSFDKAYGLDPLFMPAQENLMRLDISENKPEQARRRLVSALEKEGKNAAVMSALARLAIAQGDKASATHWLEQAVKANPDLPDTSVQLGNYYLQTGEKQKALQLAQQLQALQPGNVDVLALSAQAQLASGHSTAALDAYNKLLSLQPSSVPLLMRVSELQASLGDREAALTSVRRALAIQPGLVAGQVMQAGLMLKQQQYKAAQNVARKLQQEHPELAAGYKLEGDVFMAQKIPAAALSAYERAYQISATGSALINIHQAMLMTGQAETADRRIAAWLKDNPDDVGLRLYRANYKISAKEYKPAIEQLEFILQRQPDNVIALNDLAWSYQQIRDTRALVTAERACKLDCTDPVVLDTLGSILLEQGDIHRAGSLLQKASTLNPQSPEIAYHLGLALFKAGDAKGARRHLQALLDTHPSFPDRAAVQALVLQQ